MALVVGLLGLVVCLAYKMESNEWRRAPGALVESQRIQDVSRKDFWEHFQKALFVPTMKDYTPEICYHNFYCLELLKKGGVNWPIIDPLMSAFSAKTHDEKDVEIEEEMTDEISKLISEQLAAFDG